MNEMSKLENAIPHSEQIREKSKKNKWNIFRSFCLIFVGVRMLFWAEMRRWNTCACGANQSIDGTEWESESSAYWNGKYENIFCIIKMQNIFIGRWRMKRFIALCEYLKWISAININRKNHFMCFHFALSFQKYKNYFHLQFIQFNCNWFADAIHMQTNTIAQCYD